MVIYICLWIYGSQTHCKPGISLGWVFRVTWKIRRVHFPGTKRGKTSILSRRKSEMKRSEEKKHLKEKKKRRRRHPETFLSKNVMTFQTQKKNDQKLKMYRSDRVSPIFSQWWFSPLPSTRKLEGNVFFSGNLVPPFTGVHPPAPYAITTCCTDFLQQ